MSLLSFQTCFIMTTILSVSALAQPTRHMEAGSTSPTSRQEISIPDTGKYQKLETPLKDNSFPHQKRSYNQTINRKPTVKSPVFKQDYQPLLLGRNGGTSSVSVSDKSNEHINSKSIDGRQKHRKNIHQFIQHDIDSWGTTYNNAKNDLTKKTGISYTLDVSFLGQRGAPNGHVTPWQTQYYGTLSWDMFQSDTWGSGSLDVSYEVVRYWGATGTQLNNNIGVISGVNDYLQNDNYFYQLSYTHQLDWVSVTLGQFPLFNFDGTTYDSNQQINFLNDALSQNASSTYASAGVGAYVTVSPNQFWNVSAGFQDATNISGESISTTHLDEGKYTGFVSTTINPKNRLGQATVSLLLYHQPSVDAQPEKTNGWSLNLQQNIGAKWAVFARANGASKGLNGITQSYVVGGVYNNPLNRNTLDQIGLAMAVNKLDKDVNGESSRSVENVLEGYWAWGIGSLMTITPDIQFYINPGVNRKSNTATVASIRATLMF